jgi:glycosyltransferase involved in cell wall biosynthesis
MNTSQPRILLDARALQTGFKAHKFRGIGHYAKNLIDEILHTDSEYRFSFLHEQGLPIEHYLSNQSNLFHKPGYFLFKPSKFIEAQWSLPRFIHRDSFDLVHYLAHVDASFMTPCPYIVSVMDTITLSVQTLYSPAQRLKSRIMHSIARRIVQNAIMTISISEQTKKDIMKHYQISSDKIRVVPLAVEQRYFQKCIPEDILNFRSRYQLPESFILYVGGIDPRKNVNIIFQTMKTLIETGQHCPILVFAGRIEQEREYPEMMKFIRTLGIEHLVKFLGYVPDEDLPLLYQSSITFVYPSRYEGFGLPILQAMAAGTPVITTKLSSIPEVAGDAALYIDPDDPATLIQALQALQTNNDLRSSLIVSGKQQAGKFSWKRTANETIDVYREVLLKTQ